jgi:hypothetical protein
MRPHPIAAGNQGFQGSTWYEGNAHWTALWQVGGQPNSVVTTGGKAKVNQWAVRRWISSVNGTVRVYGKLEKPILPSGSSDTCGDGTTAHIVVDSGHTLNKSAGHQVWSDVLPGPDTAGKMYSIKLAVRKGWAIDFAISPNKSDACDSTTFTATISWPRDKPVS